jgi:hypothetical protein
MFAAKEIPWHDVIGDARNRKYPASKGATNEMRWDALARQRDQN